MEQEQQDLLQEEKDRLQEEQERLQEEQDRLQDEQDGQHNFHVEQRDGQNGIAGPTAEEAG
jgi:hypothetical protein